ncbi:MAG: hypothetical protein A2144_03795 [Chloroflexi bacterium RBG_16_50_9]|nr:MAG: hypothetical protein A2144_03795 [Chloroflexi bacterium RBG_16_50_9]
MLQHGLMMVVFNILMGVFNYLYQLSMGIMLTPAQYGTLYSLIALFTIITVLSQTIQTSITKFASRSKGRGKPGEVAYLWRASMKWTLLAGLATFGFLALLSPWLLRFLSIDNYWYALILFAALITAFAQPVTNGTLLGLQRFLPLGFSGVLSTFSKLVLAVIFVRLGFGIYGGLLPYLLSALIIFFVTMYFLRDVGRVKREKVQLGELFQYAGLALLAITSFMMLTNLDVILVKHYLSPESTGNYSVVSVLGKIAMFIPAGIVVAMFPKTSELFENGGSHRPVLVRSIIFTLILSGAVVIAYYLFPDFITNLLFRGRYPLAGPYLFKYATAMMFFALSFLLMNYLLSLNRTRVAYSLLGALLLQVVLIVFFHSDIAQIVNMMLISGIASLVFMIPFYFKREVKKP